MQTVPGFSLFAFISTSGEAYITGHIFFLTHGLLVSFFFLLLWLQRS